MASILCPGETLEELAAWALRQGIQDEHRFIFFHLRGVDLRAALAPWRAAGYGLPLVVEISTWTDMAGILGKHVNNVILRDHLPTGWSV